MVNLDVLFNLLLVGKQESLKNVPLEKMSLITINSSIIRNLRINYLELKSTKYR